jgi:cold shock CspA family protein
MERFPDEEDMAAGGERLRRGREVEFRVLEKRGGREER